jgi:hypothetical protein
MELAKVTVSVEYPVATLVFETTTSGNGVVFDAVPLSLNIFTVEMRQEDGSWVAVDYTKPHKRWSPEMVHLTREQESRTLPECYDVKPKHHYRIQGVVHAEKPEIVYKSEWVEFDTVIH